MSDDTHRFFGGKHLIVFGCGYVGGELARQAVARGMKVTALTRNATKAAQLRAAGIAVIEADLAGTDWHAQVPREVDLVLNSVSSGGGGLEGYEHSYVAGMRSILQWAASANAGTCVYTGSTSVYPQDGGAKVDETCATVPPGADRMGLLAQTEALLRASRVFRRWFVLRLAGIYGPGRHHVLDQLQGGAVLPGRSEHLLNLIHRDDAVAAIWAAFSASADRANQVYNVADDTPAPKAELVAWLAAELGRPPPEFDPNAISARRRQVPDRVILNARIKHELGWRPRYPDYRAGYADILAAL